MKRAKPEAENGIESRFQGLTKREPCQPRPAPAARSQVPAIMALTAPGPRRPRPPLRKTRDTGVILAAQARSQPGRIAPARPPEPTTAGFALTPGAAA